MRYLMTHSLLSSWLYAMKENPNEDGTTERNQYGEFLMVLNREPTETSNAMQNGIDFENLVTDIIQGDADSENKWYKSANKIAEIITGGQLQYPAQKDISINGTDLILYGRLDALKCGEIYDIKFSTKYEKGKYFDSTQHPMYFELIPEAISFTYLISNGNYLWTETYRRDESVSIIPIILDFFQWLKINDLLKIYKEKWQAL